MTAPRTTTRRRRERTAEMPACIADWFAGRATADAAGWPALLPDGEADVLAWWQQWLQEHPGATPPADAPWISWPAAAAAGSTATQRAAAARDQHQAGAAGEKGR